jgi:nicotinate phosphoribosyltransferase
VQNPARAKKWTGLRQDSGDPFLFGPRVKETYTKLGINWREKLMIYSDALDVEKAVKIQEQCNELGFEKGLLDTLSYPVQHGSKNWFLVSFGIGTFLTNDFRTLSSGSKEKSKALNIVIKLGAVNGLPCAKISDDLTKVRSYLFSHHSGLHTIIPSRTPETNLSSPTSSKSSTWKSNIIVT